MLDELEVCAFEHELATTFAEFREEEDPSENWAYAIDPGPGLKRDLEAFEQHRAGDTLNRIRHGAMVQLDTTVANDIASVKRLFGWLSTIHKADVTLRLVDVYAHVRIGEWLQAYLQWCVALLWIHRTEP